MFEMMAGRSPFDIITDNPDMNTEEYLFQGEFLWMKSSETMYYVFKFLMKLLSTVSFTQLPKHFFFTCIWHLSGVNLENTQIFYRDTVLLTDIYVTEASE